MSTAICSKTCHRERGYCRKPGECRCKVGWWGKNCEKCYPYPGCVNGNCTRPWECNCKPGWGGMLCDEGIKKYLLFIMHFLDKTTNIDALKYDQNHCAESSVFMFRIAVQKVQFNSLLQELDCFLHCIETCIVLTQIRFAADRVKFHRGISNRNNLITYYMAFQFTKILSARLKGIHN